MKSATEYLWFDTNGHREYVNSTGRRRKRLVVKAMGE
jgi:hypothetical protein